MQVEMAIHHVVIFELPVCGGDILADCNSDLFAVYCEHGLSLASYDEIKTNLFLKAKYFSFFIV